MDSQDVDAGGLGLLQNQVGGFIRSQDGLLVEERSSRLFEWHGWLDLGLGWDVRNCGLVGCLDRGLDRGHDRFSRVRVCWNDVFLLGGLTISRCGLSISLYTHQTSIGCLFSLHRQQDTIGMSHPWKSPLVTMAHWRCNSQRYFFVWICSFSNYRALWQSVIGKIFASCLVDCGKGYQRAIKDQHNGPIPCRSYASRQKDGSDAAMGRA